MAPGDVGSAEVTGAPRRRAHRWRIPVAVAVLVTAVGVACAPWLLSDPGRLGRFVTASLPELDADVSVHGARVGWFGPLVLDGIRVTPRDGTQVPLTVAQVEVANGLAAILASFGDLGSVSVRGLEADVVFDERRRTNLSGLVRSRPDEGGPSAGGPPTRSAVRMRLVLEDAIVRITGPWSPAPWVSDPIDLRVALGPAADGRGSVWSVEPVELLADARLDPGVAQGILAYIAPVLAGAARTSGRFSLRLEGATLPVGRPGDATLAGTLDMHEVVVGPGLLVENLLSSLPARLPAPPDIVIADESRVAFRLADRQVHHEGLEFGVPLAAAGQRLDIQSSGSVSIDDGALDLRLRLPIPTGLPQDRPVLAALAGKSVSVGIRGSLGEPQVVFDGSIKEAAGEFVGDLVDRLRNSNGTAAGGDTAAGDAAETAVDILSGILDEVARRRAERREVERENPDATPPRRLRERLRAPREPAAEPP